MNVSPAAGEAAEIPGSDKACPPDPAARLEQAFARHQAELLGTLYHLLGSTDDARDALQDAFVKCWQRREDLASLQCLKAWIFQVTLNTGRDMRRTAWRRRRRGLQEQMTDSLASLEPQPDHSAERREIMARLRCAIGELRPEEKEVFLLRENGELTYEQIAVAVSIPVGTAKTRMRAALAKLRLALGAVPGLG